MLNLDTLEGTKKSDRNRSLSWHEILICTLSSAFSVFCGKHERITKRCPFFWEHKFRITGGFTLTLKFQLKKSLRKIGLKVSRVSNSTPNLYEILKVDLIFDVGANQGQYAESIFNEGYKGKIVSFEPLPDVHGILEKKSQKIPTWTVFPRTAVGASVGETAINVSENSFSSSILPILKSHTQAAPNSKFIDKIPTPVTTIDSIMGKFASANSRVLLKIDTQGFEAEVLKGCMESLHNLSAIQLEMSIVPLYEGEKLYPYFFDFFARNNFKLWNIIPGFTNPDTGQLLQFDAVFVREDLMHESL